MKGSWNTSIDTYLDFPYCCQHFQDNIEHTGAAYQNEDGEMETAFNCARHRSYRIVESECEGESCPDCKLVGFDEFERLIGGASHERD